MNRFKIIFPLVILICLFLANGDAECHRAKPSREDDRSKNREIHPLVKQLVQFICKARGYWPEGAVLKCEHHSVVNAVNEFEKLPIRNKYILLQPEPVTNTIVIFGPRNELDNVKAILRTIDELQNFP